MSLFEFLMVLVSIIIGLGLAEILTGVAKMIRARATIRPYWVHAVTVVVLFIALLQQWWEIWSLRGHSEWTFTGLLMLLSGPVGLFLMAHLSFPEPAGGTDLREYYYSAMRPIWWLATLTVIAATLFRPLVFGDELFDASNATSFAFLAGFIALGASRRPILHGVLVPTFLVLLLLDIFEWSFVVGER
jgi:hypothetical protein